MAEERIATGIPRYAMLIGGMKCGSTTLFQTLAQHPQVAPSRPKEPAFFSFDRRFALGMDWYERRFRMRPRHSIALDGSPSYSRVHAWPAAPPRIARLDADVRILYVVRDPVRRIRSHVRHAMAAPWGASLLRHTDGVPRGPLRASDYAAQLDAYAAHFPRDAIMVVRLGELRERPQEALARIQDHLGVDPLDLDLRTKNRAPPRLWRARAGWGAAYRRMRSPRMRRGLRTAAFHSRRIPAVRRLLFRAEEGLPLPEGWEDEARRRLAPSMRRLRDPWGVDIAAWGF